MDRFTGRPTDLSDHRIWLLLLPRVTGHLLDGPRHALPLDEVGHVHAIPRSCICSSDRRHGLMSVISEQPCRFELPSMAVRNPERLTSYYS